MRIRAIITILLAAFVAIALGTIVMKSPAPAQPQSPVSEAASVPLGASATVEKAEPQTVAPITASAAEAQPLASSRPSGAGKPKAPAVKTQQAAKPVSTIAGVLPAQPSPKRARRVVATYFHGNVRCTTCRKVEAYAREAVEQGFQTEVAAGVVQFRAVNLEEAQNAHFAQDYQLVNKSVVVTEEIDGKVARWAKLDEVWSLVGNRDAYHHYVQDAVRGYLETE